MSNREKALNSPYLKFYKEDWEKQQLRSERDFNYNYAKKTFEEKLQFEMDVLEGKKGVVYKNKQTEKFTTESCYGDETYSRYEYWQLKHYAKKLWDSKNESTLGDSPKTYTTSISYSYIPKEMMEDSLDLFIGWENGYDGGVEQNKAAKLPGFETITWNELKTRFPKTNFA